MDDLTFPDEGAHSYENALVDENTLDVIRRIFDLIEKPTESSVLLPLLKRELHYRLLLSDAGGSLRSLLHRDSPASSIALATRQLRDKYRQSLDVTALARLVGMSVSSFHQHFKDSTHTTPLQLLKNLRLTEARRQLREGKKSVSQTSSEVGYESFSQFSREYSRKFGQAPSLDLGS